MQDKLLKILNIKIESINRNIDNLNYLNGELEKNNNDLNYLEENLSLFTEGDILNFDRISEEDFEHILLMINPNVTEIFKDKTCDYNGIIYIIKGIRQSISLQLTQDQTTAIYSFVEGMNNKALNLKEVITNLSESKKRLPETDLTILNGNLEKYQNIISKCENNLYLTEIDDIRDSLDFANVTLEEKSDIFEYILKYNADIYCSMRSEDSHEEKEEIDFKFDFPKFDYEPINVDYEPISENIEEKEDTSFQDIKLNLDNFKENQESLEAVDEIELPKEFPSLENEMPSLNFDTLPRETPEIQVENKEEEKEEAKELNTIELEDIIKKIDAKLKEIEEEEKEKENTPVSIDVAPIEESKMENETLSISNEEQPSDIENIQTKEVPSVNVSQLSYDQVFQKYSLSNINVINTNIDDVDQMLKILNEHNLLEGLRRKKDILGSILSNNTSNQIEELISLVKENLIVKQEDIENTLEMIIETMPILFTNSLVVDSFKNNLDFFKEKKINIINLFDNYREVLIMNHDILKENYDKVSLYGIDVNNDNVKYVLYNKNILTNLDSYIEAIGYEKGFLGRDDYFDGVEYIENHPYKLNNISRDMLMKLRFASENGQKIYGKPGILSGEISNPKVDILTLTPEYVLSYFNLEYEFMDRSEFLNLKNEIENLKEFDMTLDGYLNKLDSNYKKSELRYRIGNTVLSRIKTIRLYNFLKTKTSLKNALLIALTYNTVMKTEEYKNIENVVENIVGGN